MAKLRPAVASAPTSPELVGTIEVIARAVIVRNKHVLACWSVAGGYAYLPGGHVEFGERAADALARELVEEIGLKSKVGPLVLTTENTFTTHGRSGEKRHHEINLLFHVELKWGQRSREGLPATPSLEPKIEFRWIPLVGIKKSPLLPVETKLWLASTRGRAAGDLLTQKRWPSSSPTPA